MTIYFCLKQICLQLSHAEKHAKQGITEMPSAPQMYLGGGHEEPVEMEEISV